MIVAEVAARWIISGVVQGVGFRWFAARQAEDLGLCGWVRNLTDGRVEVVAAGEETAMQQFHERLRVGPRFASVDRVEKSDVPHERVGTNSFEVM